MFVENNQFIGKAILKRIFALVCLFFFSLSKVFFRYIAAESTNYQQQRIVFKVEKTAAVFLFLPNCSMYYDTITTNSRFFFMECGLWHTSLSKGNWLGKKVSGNSPYISNQSERLSQRKHFFIALYSLKFLGLNGEGASHLLNYINLFWYFFLFYFLSASYPVTWPCFAHFFGGKDRFSPFLNWKLLFWNCSAAVVQFVGCCTIFKIVFRPRKVIKWVLKRN